MMRFVWRWLKRAVVALVLLILLLLAPAGYVEVACRGDATTDAYQPIITATEWRRAESRTLLTYPEWHIVHAYDDYARVIRDGDPHDFGYFRAIAGFWAALCPLSERAAAMGGVTQHSKTTIYTIGVSFTVEMLAKAAYEETLGRLATWIRGPERSALDQLQAQQAAAYAEFLQQVPFYRWDFEGHATALAAAAEGGFRDWERKTALGIEFGVKAAYSRAIAVAVEELGHDALRMRSVVAGLNAEALAAIDGVTVIETTPEGIVIETDRYRVFTRIAERLAAAGADFVEIAGNNEILFTATSLSSKAPGELHIFARQGYGDYRHLILVPVTGLADRLRNMAGLSLEHVHDY